MTTTFEVMEHFIYNSKTVASDWPRYLMRFHNFLELSNLVLTDEGQAKKAKGRFLHVCGETITDIYMAQDDPDALTCKQILDLISAKFVKTNTRTAKYQFTQCKMLPDESIADYAIRLRPLAKAAGITSANRDGEILAVIAAQTTCNKIRMKALDQSIDLKALIEWKDTFDLKNDCANVMENNHAQSSSHGLFNINQRQWQRQSSSSKFDSKRSSLGQPQQFNNSYSNSNSYPSRQNTRSESKCYHCAETFPHTQARQFPAKGKRCTTCNKWNHLAIVCKSGPPSQLINRLVDTNDQQNHETPIIPSLESLSIEQQQEMFATWYAEYAANASAEKTGMNQILTTFDFNPFAKQSDKTTVDKQEIHQMTQMESAACPRTYITIGNTRVKHLVDSGTQLNIISQKTYAKLIDQPSLKTTNVQAFAFNSKTRVPLLGEFFSEIKHKQRAIFFRYLVLNGEAEDIIGFRTAKALGIIQVNLDTSPRTQEITLSPRINIINTMDQKKYFDPLASHPKLFTGRIGSLKDFELNLTTDPNIRPIQQPAYPIPFALHDLTEAKLSKLVEAGIISRYHGPITWLSPIHPVPKINTAGEIIGVRITVNNRQLNKSLIAQKRHIPSITELSYALNGMKWFSKLDFNDAFNQIKLNASSRLITAMNTKFGIYVWNCLNMGLKTASV
jgi:hypothetical protein